MVAFGVTILSLSDFEADDSKMSHAPTFPERVPKARSLLRAGPAWKEILSAAAELHADLIVVGTHGRRGLNRISLDSTAEKVVRMAEVPVLTADGASEPQ